MQMRPVLKYPMTFLFLVNATCNRLSYHSGLNRAGRVGGAPWTAKARADSSRLYSPQRTCRIEVGLMHSPAYTAMPWPPHSGWCPVPEVVVSQPACLQLPLQEDLEKVAHALVELGVEVVMPLLQPRDDLRQASQQWLEPFDRPTFLLRYLRIPGRQGSSLLQVVPTSPADSSAASASREQNG